MEAGVEEEGPGVGAGCGVEEERAEGVGSRGAERVPVVAGERPPEVAAAGRAHCVEWMSAWAEGRVG